MRKKTDISYRAGKRIAREIEAKGALVDLCASYSDQYICCKTFCAPLVSNCPSECSYCFLQSYLTETRLSIVNSVDGIIAEVENLSRARPGALIRFGAWELGDNLALEESEPVTRDLIERVGSSPARALLELKTKSARIEFLKGIDHNDKTVIAWTLNPDKIIRAEEFKTAPISARLDAARRVIDFGYNVAFHFDPIIYARDWSDLYLELIERLFESIPVERVTWISLGALRMSRALKGEIALNYPNSKILSEEAVFGADKLARYPRPRRALIYKTMVGAIERASAGRAPLIYLCMERANVWRAVFGERAPRSSSELDYRFALSIHERFRRIAPSAPDRADYLDS